VGEKSDGAPALAPPSVDFFSCACLVGGGAGLPGGGCVCLVVAMYSFWALNAPHWPLWPLTQCWSPHTVSVGGSIINNNKTRAKITQQKNDKLAALFFIILLIEK
jgi:hypothetical protein